MFINFHAILISQQKNRILAEIGALKITENEFKVRFELSPFVSQRSKSNQDTIKTDFLYSMIAERLWYLDALEQGLTSTEDFNFYFKPLIDIYLRDYLFREEIENNIVLSQADIVSAIEKAQFKLKTRIINSSDSIRIFDVYNLLTRGVSLDSIFKFPEYALLSVREFELTLGSLKDEEIENYLFTLSRDEFSSPIRSEIGWVIFYVIDKLVTPIDISDQKITNEIKQKVRSRRTMIVSQKYLDSLLSGQIFDINDSIFNIIFETIFSIILERTKDNPDSLKASYVLTDNDYRIIKSNLGKEVLNKPLFYIYDQNVTVWDFLANLAFEEHRFQSKDKNRLYSRLIGIAKNFVVQQRLVYEAKKKNIDRNKNLLSELDYWKINYLSTQNKLQFLDSARVSEEELKELHKKELEKDTEIILLKLKVLTLSDQQEVRRVKNQLVSGKSFDEILNEYGKTDSLVINDKGETDLKPYFYFGELGEIAKNLKLNEVYGPIQRGNKFTLFSVIDKKIVEGLMKADFEESKEYLRNYLFQKKFNKLTAQRTLQLAEKYGVRVYFDVLRDIKTTSLPTFAHRFMGFGGKIAAVPLLDNWFRYIDWIDFNSKLLP